MVFVSGPNNNNPGTKGPINSVFRTYNDMTATRFDKFMEGVEAALFAGLISMVQSKCTIALLVYVSVVSGNFIVEQLNPVINEIEIPSVPLAFTDNPPF